MVNMIGKIKKVWNFILRREESTADFLERTSFVLEQELYELERSFYAARRKAIEEYDLKLRERGFVFPVRCSDCSTELESSNSLLLHHTIINGKIIDVYVCPKCGKVEYIDTKYRPGMTVRYKPQPDDNFLSIETYRFIAMRKKYFEKHPEEIQEYIDSYADLYTSNPEIYQIFIESVAHLLDESFEGLHHKKPTIEDGVPVIRDDKTVQKSPVSVHRPGWFMVYGTCKYKDSRGRNIYTVIVIDQDTDKISAINVLPPESQDDDERISLYSLCIDGYVKAGFSFEKARHNYKTIVIDKNSDDMNVKEKGYWNGIHILFKIIESSSAAYAGYDDAANAIQKQCLLMI